MDEIIERVTAYYRGFGFDYSKVITDENETIWYTTLFFFKKSLTFAISNGDWVDNDGKTKYFKLEDKTLYIKKLAIGI